MAPGGDDAARRWRRAEVATASRKWAKRYRTEIAACSSTLTATAMTYPLDSMKTRMQAYTFRNFTAVVRHTFETEGPRGFWRGALAPLASMTATRTFSFSVYQRAKHTLDGWIAELTGSSPLAIANGRGAVPTGSTMLCFAGAGAVSGAFAAPITSPFELTKNFAQISNIMLERSAAPQSLTELCVDGRGQAHGALRMARELVRQRGVRILYAGFRLHMLRDTIGSSAYFVTYESAKQLLANARGNSPDFPLAVMAAGGLCGIASWAVIYPLDSVKTTYQRYCLEGVERQRPFPRVHYFRRHSYRGVGASMSRSFILNSIFFSLFEFAKRGINGWDDESAAG